MLKMKKNEKEPSSQIWLELKNVITKVNPSFVIPTQLSTWLVILAIIAAATILFIFEKELDNLFLTLRDSNAYYWIYGIMILSILIYGVMFAVKKWERKERGLWLAKYEQARTNILTGPDPVSWVDVFIVAEYLGRGLFQENNSDIVKRIPLATLGQLATVSKFKKQLTWDSTLQQGLSLLEKIAKYSYEDEVLEALIKQVDTFTRTVLLYKEFKGYDALIKQLDVCCPTLYSWVKWVKEKE